MAKKKKMWECYTFHITTHIYWKTHLRWSKIRLTKAGITDYLPYVVLTSEYKGDVLKKAENCWCK